MRCSGFPSVSDLFYAKDSQIRFRFFCARILPFPLPRASHNGSELKKIGLLKSASSQPYSWPKTEGRLYSRLKADSKVGQGPKADQRPTEGQLYSQPKANSIVGQRPTLISRFFQFCPIVRRANGRLTGGKGNPKFISNSFQIHSKFIFLFDFDFMLIVFIPNSFGFLDP